MQTAHATPAPDKHQGHQMETRMPSLEGSATMTRQRTRGRYIPASHGGHGHGQPPAAGDMPELASEITIQAQLQCNRLNAILTDIIQAGRILTLSVDNRSRYYVHDAGQMGTGVEISYGTTPPRRVREGCFGARISTRNAAALAQALLERRESFCCLDADDYLIRFTLR